MVIVALGGNDMLHGIDERTIGANLAAIVLLAQRHRAQVVLLAIPRPSGLRAAVGKLSPADFYSTLASNSDIVLIADAVSDVLSDSTLRLDPLHPNPAGHAVLSSNLEGALRKTGLLR